MATKVHEETATDAAKREKIHLNVYKEIIFI